MRKNCKIFFLFAFLVLGNNVKAQSLAWAKQFIGAGYEGGYSVAVDAGGYVYTGGSFDGPTDFDPGPGTYIMNCLSSFEGSFISKLDASGNFIWAKQLAAGGAEDRVESVAVDASGNVYTTGFFMGTCDFDPGPGTYNLVSGFASDDIFVSKLDSSGNFIWAKDFGGTDYNIGLSVKVDGNGNVYTTGRLQSTADFDPGIGIYNLSSGGSYDIFVSKLDASGNFVWAKEMGGPGADDSNCLYVDISGNVYTTGTFSGNVDFNPGPGAYNLNAAGNYDIFISKLDASGNFVWARQIGGTIGENAHSITMDTNGIIYLTGSFQGTVDFDPEAGTYNMTSAGNADFFICTLNASGNFIWAKQMGGAGAGASGICIIVDAGSIYTLGGFGNTVDFDPGTGIFNLTSAGYTDIFISILDITGNFISAVRMGGDSTEVAKSLALSNSGDIYATGWIYDTADFDPGPNIYNLIPAGLSDVYIVKLSDIPTNNGQVESRANNVFLFPNPTASELRIDNAELKIEAVEIYNMLGEKVFPSPFSSPLLEERGTGGEVINVSSLPPGIYFVKVKGEKEERVAKFVKQ